MKTHVIKLHKKYCDAVFEGRKKFEVRLNDRHYRVDDRIAFLPVDGNGDFYDHPVKFQIFQIAYLYDGHGLQYGYVVLGLRQIGALSAEGYRTLQSWREKHQQTEEEGDDEA